MLATAWSTVFWFLYGVISILLFPIAFLIWLITYPFDRRRVLLHKFTCFWAGILTWLNPCWSVTVSGKEHIDRKQTYVIVSNHLSTVDIVAAFRLFIHFKWVSKAEIFKIPFIGWNMYLNNYIKLRRGSNKGNAQMMRETERALRTHNSVYIFPEGTRSNNGRVGKFRRGAFELAKRTGLPILPIVIEGSERALPKKGVALRGFHRIKFEVLKPILPETFHDKDVDRLTTEVQALIQARHEEILAR
ncbi:MAG: 1-acyl-sn-glycerol-3-phosphate acyltransferase [Leptospiraceae bacterium]|nr:1-acyl-sn-glycerol-3-phosphate acyltransferase [Leptospiraceae bacterium]